MFNRVSSYVWASAASLLAGAAFQLTREWLNFSRASLLYLPLLIFCATRLGLGPAVVGAIISFCCCDYLFVHPYYSLVTDSAADLSSLLVFLAVAIATANLAARERRYATQSLTRERENAILYEASFAVSRQVDPDRLMPTLAEQIVGLCGSPICVVMWRGEPGGPLRVCQAVDSPGSETDLDSHILETADQVLAKDLVLGFDCEPAAWPEKCRRMGMDVPADAAGYAGLYVPLHARDEIVGVLYAAYRADGRPFSAHDNRIVHTLANEAAVVIARQIMIENAEEQARRTAVLEERNRLAREVHDTLSNTFISIKYLLEAAGRTGQSPQAEECLAEAREMAVAGAQQARRSVMDLRTAPLDQAGDLQRAIGRLVRASNPLGPRVDFLVTGQPRPLDPAIAEGLLRIFQEALGNAVRHSSAEHVHVLLDFAQDNVALTVRDDGNGFDVSEVDASVSFGLISMQQRCAEIGADLRVVSRPHEGTEITARWEPNFLPAERKRV